MRTCDSLPVKDVNDIDIWLYMGLFGWILQLQLEVEICRLLKYYNTWGHASQAPLAAEQFRQSQRISLAAENFGMVTQFLQKKFTPLIASCRKEIFGSLYEMRCRTKRAGVILGVGLRCTTGIDGSFGDMLRFPQCRAVRQCCGGAARCRTLFLSDILPPARGLARAVRIRVTVGLMVWTLIFLAASWSVAVFFRIQAKISCRTSDPFYYDKHMLSIAPNMQDLDICFASTGIHDLFRTKRPVCVADAGNADVQPSPVALDMYAMTAGKVWAGHSRPGPRNWKLWPSSVCRDLLESAQACAAPSPPHHPPPIRLDTIHVDARVDGVARARCGGTPMRAPGHACARLRANSHTGGAHSSHARGPAPAPAPVLARDAPCAWTAPWNVGTVIAPGARGRPAPGSAAARAERRNKYAREGEGCTGGPGDAPLPSSTHSAAAAARLDAALGFVACVEVDVGVGVGVRVRKDSPQRAGELTDARRNHPHFPESRKNKNRAGAGSTHGAIVSCSRYKDMSRLQMVSREDKAPKNPTFTTARSGIVRDGGTVRRGSGQGCGRLLGWMRDWGDGGGSREGEARNVTDSQSRPSNTG
ncbi:hypothetical protein GGX14DRAFT_390305 [Mycena pura]|uniref:Uncharacterized protein n=1 Tax=Mycena pura TaxID=153505 RepID=A0AAD6YK75_9AGAR|nr:hypothetical protein GGX14DRAFT_390305 [Mycena pura]